MKKKILIYSGSRSEYGILKYLIFGLNKQNNFTTKLLLSGTHFSSKYGKTYNEAISDNISFDKLDCKFSSDNFLKLNKSLSRLHQGFSKYINKRSFDYLFILGDRMDLIPVALVALIKGIIVCHIHGGEVTKYLVDDYIRHAVTKFSDVHFVSTEKYKKRIIQLGENPKKIFNVGSLAIDGISKMKFKKKNELEKLLNVSLTKKFFLITYQPLSLNLSVSIKEFNILINSLLKFKNHNLIFTFPNIDIGSDKIIKLLQNLKNKKKNIFIFKSLGHLNYISLARYASAVVGNSSSGIIEIPYLGTPVVNIGSRQSGREKHKMIINIEKINLNILTKKLRELTLCKKKIYKYMYQNNLYGKGDAVKKIINILNKDNIKSSKKLKKFYDI
jgi:GDP/UDP-N,N'-diacetylbacillosamine 2-epimerase (hydrolysing)